LSFDWDQRKAEVNLRKHGVSFHEAATVFLDPMAMSGPDPDHSIGEDRYITFRFSRLGRLLTHTEVVKGTSVALLDPTIAKAFPTSQAVNEALYGLLALAENTTRINRRSSGRAKARR
jgi:uncharacterized protein